jgi:hypothetical protein
VFGEWVHQLVLNKQMTVYKISGSHSDVAEDSSFLGCDAVFGEQLVMFQRHHDLLQRWELLACHNITYQKARIFSSE